MQRLHSSRKAAKEEMGYAPISNLRINTLLSFVLSVSSVVKPSFRGFCTFRGLPLFNPVGEARAILLAMSDKAFLQ